METFGNSPMRSCLKSFAVWTLWLQVEPLGVVGAGGGTVDQNNISNENDTR